MYDIGGVSSGLHMEGVVYREKDELLTVTLFGKTPVVENLMWDFKNGLPDCEVTMVYDINFPALDPKRLRRQIANLDSAYVNFTKPVEKRVMKAGVEWERLEAARLVYDIFQVERFEMDLIATPRRNFRVGKKYSPGAQVRIASKPDDHFEDDPYRPLIDPLYEAAIYGAAQIILNEKHRRQPIEGVNSIECDNTPGSMYVNVVGVTTETDKRANIESDRLTRIVQDILAIPHSKYRGK